MEICDKIKTYHLDEVEISNAYDDGYYWPKREPEFRRNKGTNQEHQKK
jgi:hypothetical protein